MSKTRLHTKRLTLHLVVRNEQRFKNLHGVVGNKERFGDKKFLNVIAYLQSEIHIFLVFVSSGDLTFGFRARWLSCDLTVNPFFMWIINK